MRWLASRCRSTATASRCATGCTSATTARRSASCWRAAGWARPTTSAAGTSRPTWTSYGASAHCSTNCAPTRRAPHERLIRFVADRPGHDRRYAIDARKLERELGWRPAETFDSGIRKTVAWYLAHADWVTEVKSGAYRAWLDTNYAARAAA